ncbi:MAG: FkbM family methyltransferase [Sphingobacteriia bacterium]|nr:FkbM family methyltransferase [Sphingobacteriia bacterium]
MQDTLTKQNLNQSDLEKIGFEDSPMGKAILNKAIGFIDVGAKDEIIDEFKPISNYLDVIFFEPNKNEYEKLINRNQAYHSCKFFNAALSNEEKQADLHITKSSMCSSLYSPHPHYTSRYGLVGYDVENIETISVSSLDSVLKNEKFTKDDFFILKLDAQGADLDIIKGGKEFIQNNVCAIISEVNFFPSYSNIPLFSEVELYLRELGFSFITFTDYMFRSHRRTKPAKSLSRQRLFHADALFVKDPILNASNIKNDSFPYYYIILFMLYNLYDSAIEIAEKLITNPVDREESIKVITKAEELYLERAISRANKGLNILQSSNDNKEILYYLNNRTIL